MTDWRLEVMLCLFVSAMVVALYLLVKTVARIKSNWNRHD